MPVEMEGCVQEAGVSAKHCFLFVGETLVHRQFLFRRLGTADAEIEVNYVENQSLSKVPSF